MFLRVVRASVVVVDLIVVMVTPAVVVVVSGVVVCLSVVVLGTSVLALGTKQGLTKAHMSHDLGQSSLTLGVEVHRNLDSATHNPQALLLSSHFTTGQHSINGM